MLLFHYRLDGGSLAESTVCQLWIACVLQINFAPPRLSLGGIIDLAIGPADSVQITTTYLSPSVRVGRGSRGSWFYFTKGGPSDAAGEHQQRTQE